MVKLRILSTYIERSCESRELLTQWRSSVVYYQILKYRNFENVVIFIVAECFFIFIMPHLGLTLHTIWVIGGFD